MTTSMMNDVSLVLWNCPDAKDVAFRPTVEHTRAELRNAGLPDKYADTISDAQAFRRAAEQCRGRDRDAKVFKADDELYVQIEQLHGDKDDQGAKLERQIIGVWEHTVNGPKQVRGHAPETHGMLHLEYEVAKTTYDFGDIGQMIQLIIKGEALGSYSPRKAGGVYFVPTDASCATVLDKIEAFSGRLGINFLRFGTPDTDAARDEVAQAVAHGIGVDVAAHRKAVDTYTAETRGDVFAHRRTLISQTVQLIIRLAGRLGDHGAALVKQLDEMVDKIKGYESQAASGGQAFGRKVLVAKGSGVGS